MPRLPRSRLSHGLDDLIGSAGLLLGDQDPGVTDDSGQPCATLLQNSAGQILAVEVQEVEGVEDNLRVGRRRMLESLEAWEAPLNPNGRISGHHACLHLTT